MARRPGAGKRWLGAIALPAALCCAAPPQAPVPAAAPPPPSVAALVNKDKKVQMDKPSSPNAPDAALLDYIGRYGDAAIGLDPLGLAADGDTGVPDKEPQ